MQSYPGGPSATIRELRRRKRTICPCFSCGVRRNGRYVTDWTSLERDNHRYARWEGSELSIFRRKTVPYYTSLLSGFNNPLCKTHSVEGAIHHLESKPKISLTFASISGLLGKWRRGGRLLSRPGKVQKGKRKAPKAKAHHPIVRARIRIHDYLSYCQ